MVDRAELLGKPKIYTNRVIRELDQFTGRNN